MKLSIVVPTYNEEKLLPRLLSSIRSQAFEDYEIIVADNNSTDRTAEIAESFGAKVVPGGMPAAGRNSGAAHAKGEILFFFDADVILPENFLADTYGLMQERFLDLATCETRPLSNYTLDRLIHQFTNLTIRMTLRFDPHAWGFCIFVTKRLFDRVSGFDESIRFGEDSEFVKRAAKFRSLHYLDEVHVLVSVRRFEKEGRLQLAKKTVKFNFYRAFKGEIRDDTFEYQFGHYDEEENDERKTLLDRIEDALMKLEVATKQSAQVKRRQRRPSIPTEQRRLLEEVKEDFKRFFRKAERS